MDILTAADCGQQEAEDTDLLAHALADQRVMLTNDADFLALATEYARRGEIFAPIFFWPQQQRGIGEMLRKVVRVATVHSYEEASSRVFFL
jgi:predicted nuclease of predicted toxin-antitoxin system